MELNKEDIVLLFELRRLAGEKAKQDFSWERRARDFDRLVRRMDDEYHRQKGDK